MHIFDFPSVCIDIKITTGMEGKLKKWTFGPCSNAHKYEDFTQYVERCCLLKGQYTLTCINTGRPEGWKRGFIEIQGHRYCDDFMSFKEMHQIDIEGIFGIYQGHN